VELQHVQFCSLGDVVNDDDHHGEHAAAAHVAMAQQGFMALQVCHVYDSMFNDCAQEVGMCVAI